MFCGTRSFSKVDVDPAAPRPPKRSGSKKKRVSRRSKNPYSGSGLDKFSKVMSELQAKREQIIAEASGGSTSQGDVVMVLFMYDNSRDWTPIVVRLRENQPPSRKKSINKKPQPQPLPPLLPPPQSEQSNSEVEARIPLAATTEEKKKKKIFSWQGKEGWIERWRPSYCWLVVIVVVLVCLVMFGRVFAVCCTSIWWYLVPILKGDEIVDVRRSMKKKDYTRRVSDKRLGGGIPVIAASPQPKRVSGFQESTSPRSHGIHENEKKR